MNKIKLSLTIIMAVNLIACHSSKKNNINDKVNNPSVFTIKDKHVEFNSSKKVISCDLGCEVIGLFVKTKHKNSITIYNKLSEKLFSGSKNNIKLTKSFLKVRSSNKLVVYSGFSGKEIFSSKDLNNKIELSDYFFTFKSNLNISIYNLYGQLIKKDKASIYLKTYLSNGFVGYQLDNRRLVIYNRGQHKLINYSFPSRESLVVELNDSFFYYKVGSSTSSLFHVSGQRLMRFDGRPTEKVFLTENVVGFYDISNSASFWNKKGTHLKSIKQQPGLEVVMQNNKILYKDGSKEFKSFN